MLFLGRNYFLIEGSFHTTSTHQIGLIHVFWSLVLHPSWSHGSEQLDGHVYQKLVNQLPLRKSKIWANHTDDNIVSQPNGAREDLKNHQKGSLLSLHPTPLQKPDKNCYYFI